MNYNYLLNKEDNYYIFNDLLLKNDNYFYLIKYKMVYSKPEYIVCKFIYENTKEMINIQNTKNEKNLDNYKNYLSNFKNHENKSNYFKY